MNDPFANLGNTESSGDEKAQEASATEFFLDFELGEEEFEQPIAFVPYRMPKEGTWIPVKIMESGIALRDMRRVMTDQDTGAEAVEDKVATPRFEMEAQHVAGCYGDRGRSYLLGMPVEDVTMPFNSGSNRKGVGFKKISGRKVVAATRVLKPGERVTGDNLKKLADDMVGRIVMAQVRYSHKEYTNSDPVTDSMGQTVRVKVNNRDEKVEIVEKGGQLVMKETGEPFPGDTSRLFKYEGTYYIPDPSDDGVMLKTIRATTRTFDNLKDDVAPVPGMVLSSDDVKEILGSGSPSRPSFTVHENPNGSFLVERLIQVVRKEGAPVYAQVTWDTVGQIATKPVKSGTPVQAVTFDGELLTATWIGTSWVETPVEHRLEVNELGALTFVPVASDHDDQGDPLDAFKG